MKLFRQLVIVFFTVLVLFGGLMMLSMEIINIEWISFMEIQPSFDWDEEPLPVPERSVPIQGPVNIEGMGAPVNPVPADEVSIQRASILYEINCLMCHGSTGEGNGQIAALLANRPANLTLDVTQSKSDGALFLTLTNGIPGRMPPMIQNLTERDRWDMVNYIRTLAAGEE